MTVSDQCRACNDPCDGDGDGDGGGARQSGSTPPYPTSVGISRARASASHRCHARDAPPTTARPCTAARVLELDAVAPSGSVAVGERVELLD